MKGKHATKIANRQVSWKDDVCTFAQKSVAKASGHFKIFIHFIARTRFVDCHFVGAIWFVESDCELFFMVPTVGVQKSTQNNLILGQLVCEFVFNLWNQLTRFFFLLDNWDRVLQYWLILIHRIGLSQSTKTRHSPGSRFVYRQRNRPKCSSRRSQLSRW